MCTTLCTEKQLESHGVCCLHHAHCLLRVWNKDQVLGTANYETVSDFLPIISNTGVDVLGHNVVGKGHKQQFDSDLGFLSQIWSFVRGWTFGINCVVKAWHLLIQSATENNNTGQQVLCFNLMKAQRQVTEVCSKQMGGVCVIAARSRFMFGDIPQRYEESSVCNDCLQREQPENACDGVSESWNEKSV